MDDMYEVGMQCLPLILSISDNDLMNDEMLKQSGQYELNRLNRKIYNEAVRVGIFRDGVGSSRANIMNPSFLNDPYVG